MQLSFGAEAGRARRDGIAGTRVTGASKATAVRRPPSSTSPGFSRAETVDRPGHGYAIPKEAEERTGGPPGFEIPTLYRALRRLRDEGMLRTADAPDTDPDERREYWEATEQGRKTPAAELARLEVAVAVGPQHQHGGGLLRADPPRRDDPLGLRARAAHKRRTL